MKHIGLYSLKLLTLIAGTFASSAGASGFHLLEQNVSDIGNAYADSASTVENASIIFYNPAGRTQLKDREFSLGVTAIKPSYQFNGKGWITGVNTLGVFDC